MDVKAEGNKLFQAGDYPGAVQKYTEAIAIDPEVFFEYFFLLFPNYSSAKTGSSEPPLLLEPICSFPQIE